MKNVIIDIGVFYKGLITYWLRVRAVWENIKLRSDYILQLCGKHVHCKIKSLYDIEDK